MYKVGDHLVTPRNLYTHHGIYAGDGYVIHYSGLADDKSDGTICFAKLDEFSSGHEVTVKPHPNRKYSADETIDRAISRIGEDWYNVIANNCEQFVTWCIEGIHSSEQVNRLINGIVSCAACYEVYKRYKDSGRPMTSIAVSEIYASMFVEQGKNQLTNGLLKNTASLATTALSSSAANLATTSTASTTAGIITGSAAGVVTGSTVGTAATGIVAGVVGTTAAPLVATVVVGAAFGYGVKKLVDWLSD